MSVYFNQSSINNSPKGGSSSALPRSSAAPTVVIIAVIVITVGLLLISLLVFVIYMRRSKKRRANDSSSFTSRSISSSQNTIKDLPSRPVQTITIPSGELKPVKSSVFVWRDTNRGQSAKNSKTINKNVNMRTSYKANPKSGHKINKNITAKGKTNAVPIAAQNKHINVKPVVKPTQNIKPKQNSPKLQNKTTAKPKVFNKK